MKRDEVFSTPQARGSDFEFDSAVAEAFDDMISRSVPHYAEQQAMITEIGRAYWQPGHQIYDLGCSTATTLINLAQTLGQPAHLIGYDNSEPMLAQGRRKLVACGLDGRVELQFGDLNDDLAKLSLSGAGLVTLCWTLQFVRPMQRDRLVRWIYDSLPENGVLIVTEKILSGSSRLNRLFIDLYYDRKRRNGYSDTEIQKKREALENVLVPYRIDENLELFRRNGFAIVDTFYQWYNFAGFVCVKGKAAESALPQPTPA